MKYPGPHGIRWNQPAIKQHSKKHQKGNNCSVIIILSGNGIGHHGGNKKAKSSANNSYQECDAIGTENILPVCPENIVIRLQAPVLWEK